MAILKDSIINGNLKISGGGELILNGENSVVDYVVENGTSGNWEYRKWASGKAELWSRNTYTRACNHAWGSTYTSGDDNPIIEYYPTDFFATSNPVYCIYSMNPLDNTHSVNYWLATSGVASFTHTPKLQFVRSTTATVTGTILWHAIGKWK